MRFKMDFQKKTPYIIVGLLGLFALFYSLRFDLQEKYLEFKKGQLPKEVSSEEAGKQAANASQKPQDQESAKLPEEINLRVPFSPQAPHANWDLPYQEACEETSALLTHKFFKGGLLTPVIADNEILKIVDWEKENLGYYEHTTALETASILHEYFGYKRVEVQYDVSIDDIKKHVAAGRPVIVPLAGRLLGNPFYRAPGPVYHMLVVKGYTKEGKLITNDVGTRRGENYLYDPEVFLNAMHDAPSGGSAWGAEKPEDYILTGKRAIIVVYPNA